MIKSEFISLISSRITHLSEKQIVELVNTILETMTDALIQGSRIEVRGFGSFSRHYHAPRQARNPKTGVKIQTEGKYVPHFKPGKALKERLNQGNT